MVKKMKSFDAQLKETKAKLKNLCNDDKMANKLISELLLIDRQNNIKPTLAYVEDGDIVGKIENGAYTITQSADNNVVYHINGVDIIFSPTRFETQQLMLLVEQKNKLDLSKMDLSPYLDGKKKFKELGKISLLNQIKENSGNIKNILDVNEETYNIIMNSFCILFQNIVMALNSDKYVFALTNFLGYYLQASSNNEEINIEKYISENLNNN